MINNIQLGIFKKFNGDADAFDRAASADEKMLMGDSWPVIADLIHDLILIYKQHAGDDYKSEVERRLERVCESKAVANGLKELAVTLSR